MPIKSSIYTHFITILGSLPLTNHDFKWLQSEVKDLATRADKWILEWDECEFLTLIDKSWKTHPDIFKSTTSPKEKCSTRAIILMDYFTYSVLSNKV